MLKLKKGVYYSHKFNQLFIIDGSRLEVDGESVPLKDFHQMVFQLKKLKATYIGRL